MVGHATENILDKNAIPFVSGAIIGTVLLNVKRGELGEGGKATLTKYNRARPTVPFQNLSLP